MLFRTGLKMALVLHPFDLLCFKEIISYDKSLSQTSLHNIRSLRHCQLLMYILQCFMKLNVLFFFFFFVNQLSLKARLVLAPSLHKVKL